VNFPFFRMTEDKWVDSFDDLNKVDEIPDYEPGEEFLPLDYKKTVEKHADNKADPKNKDKSTFGGFKKPPSFLQKIKNQELNDRVSYTKWHTFL